MLVASPVCAEVITLRCSFLPAPNGDKGPPDFTMDVDRTARTVAYMGRTYRAEVGDRYITYFDGTMRLDRRTLVIGGRNASGVYGDVIECKRAREEGI